MPNYRLLITDIDGTLIPYGAHEISQENVDALISLQEKGVKVVLASGRVAQGITDFANTLRLDEFGGYVISNNGAEMVDWKTKEILYRNYLLPEEVIALNEERLALGTNAMLMQEDYVIMSGYDQAIQIDHDAVSVDFIWPHDFGNYLHLPTLRFGFTAPIPRLDEVELLLREKFGATMEVLRPQPIFLDVMSKGVDKGSALKALAKQLAIPLSDIIACGDGGNDIGMIEEAGLGIAVSNAHPQAKAVANVIGPQASEHLLAWIAHNYF